MVTNPGVRVAATGSADPSLWLSQPGPRAHARITLVCFHSAGSGAAMFHRWPNRLPDWVNVALVRMPGRESRLREPSLTDYGTAVDALTAALEGALDRPYALLGHSMGAHLAFGVAAARHRAGARPASHLFLSGTRAPHLFRPPLSPRSSDGELVDALLGMGGTAPELLENDEMRRIVLPIFRADLSVCAGVRLPRSTVQTDLSVFGGEQDDVPWQDLDEWRRWSGGRVMTTMFRGGHFFLIKESEDAVLRTVVRTLDEITQGTP
jgi:surfactin synthase thioesterase subunit